jgi:hypothetical protein
MLGNLIGGFIVIVVGTSLMPVVANQVAGLGNNNVGNVSGAALTISNLITLFYALGLMSSGVALAVSGLKQAGIM